MMAICWHIDQESLSPFCSNAFFVRGYIPHKSFCKLSATRNTKVACNSIANSTPKCNRLIATLLKKASSGDLYPNTFLGLVLGRVYKKYSAYGLPFLKKNGIISGST